jgi:hypothetical protein
MMVSATAVAALLMIAGPVAKTGTGARAAGSRGSGTEGPAGKEVRVIPLDDKRASRVHIVRTAPSYPCTIEFPEAFTGAPACGDCGKKDGLFYLDVFNEGRYLTVKPRVFAGPQPDGSSIPVQDFVTVLTVRLQTYTLTIQVEYTEDASRADPRVVFTLPQRSTESAYVQAELAKGRKALEEEMATKIQRGVTAAFLGALTEPHSCSSLSNRVRHDDIVIEARELCQFGGNYYVRFTIENRGRAAAEIADISLRYGSGSALTNAAELEHHVSNEHLEFQAIANGVVGFKLEDGQAPPRSFELTARERGGRARVVTLSGIEP